MNSILLLLAMATGQCGPQGCDAPALEPWRDFCVRVRVEQNGHGFAGSGTIVDVVGKAAIVVTNRHVVDHQGQYLVEHRGHTYEAMLLSRSNDGDLAALAIAAPPGARKLYISNKSGRNVFALGFGRNNQLHAHDGGYAEDAIPHRYNAALQPDHHYGFASGDGDSGCGVFDERGYLSGVLWGGSGNSTSVVSNAKLRQFLDIGPSEETRFTLTPFFLKCVRRRAARPQSPQTVVESPVSRQPIPAPDPDSGVTVQAPGVGVQVGPTAPPQVVQGPIGATGANGKDGRNGVDGQNGKDADPAALAALTNQINTLTQNMGKLAGAVQAIQNQPPPAQGPIGATGATGANGKDADPAVLAALTKAVTALQNQSIYIQFQTPNGPSQTQQFTLKTDPSGNLFYAIQLNPTSLAPTTVPVTPLPSTSSK